jgi:ubiquinone/menaquinone biosynthesis C-methylase UbiE
MLSKNESALVNLKAWRSAAVVADYAGSTDLQCAEVAILSRIRNAFRHKRILDIGIGGGRTTAALLDISDNYIGIDFSPEMVAASRQRYPSVLFEVCDAREMSRFQDRSFDFIMFSYNGIDNVGHSDRLRILGEIYRVLAYPGVFVFSSHNRRGLVRRPWTRYYIYRKANPLRHPQQFLKLFMQEFISDCIGHFRNRWREVRSDEFAIINDEGHHFALLTYYIDIEGQINQARTIGFEDIHAVGLNGDWLSQSDWLTCSDAWIYYLCHKHRDGQGSNDTGRFYNDLVVAPSPILHHEGTPIAKKISSG